MVLAALVSLLPGQTVLLAADALWISTTPLEANRQLLLVVDQQRQTLAVYHIDTTTGEATLRSTRSLAYDLALEEFNATDPRPTAIRAMLRDAGAVKNRALQFSDRPQIVPTPAAPVGPQK